MSHVITHIADPGAGVAEDHHGGAVVIINQGPEIRAGAHLARRELELEIIVIKCLEKLTTGHSVTIYSRGWV